MGKCEVCFGCEKGLFKGEGFRVTMVSVKKGYPWIRDKIRTAVCDECGWSLRDYVRMGKKTLGERLKDFLLRRDLKPQRIKIGGYVEMTEEILGEAQEDE